MAEEYGARAWELDVSIGNANAPFIGRSYAQPSRPSTLDSARVVDSTDAEVVVLVTTVRLESTARLQRSIT